MTLRQEAEERITQEGHEMRLKRMKELVAREGQTLSNLKYTRYLISKLEEGKDPGPSPQDPLGVSQDGD